MAYFKNGVLTNTEEDNKLVEEWLNKQSKIGLIDPETGELYATVPYVVMNESKKDIKSKK